MMMNYSRRVEQLRSGLRQKNIDAFITVHLPNVRYLTGFSGSHGLCVVTKERIFFFTDFRYQEQIRSEVTADTIFIQKGNLLACKPFQSVMSRVRTIGFEKTRLSASEYFDLKKIFTNKRLIPAEGLVEAIRAVKDADEISLLRTAAEITDKVFESIVGKIKAGISELDVSAEISFLHKKYGAENDAFDTIVASGGRGALPHGAASSKKIRNKEFVTLDFGCIYQGYHSDMTRTICVGTPTQEMKKVYRVVLDSQLKSLEYMREAASAKKTDSIARSHISKHGFGKYFGHSLGHGVGLEIHEDLRLSQQSEEKLKPGNVVTVEPGIYLPSKFGVRIEDMVVVRSAGVEFLSTSPKELITI